MEDNTFSTATTTSLDVTTAYLHHDPLGSVIFISGEDGAVVAGSRTHTLPFGGYDNGPPTADITDFGYTGHRHNDDLGLIDMNARYDDPFVRRFVSADAIVPQPTNPQSFNRYSYTLNNPLRYNDPGGHEPCASNNWGDCALAPLLPSLEDLPGAWPDPSSSDFRNIVGQTATEIGIPFPILYGVLYAEMALDTDWKDGVENWLFGSEAGAWLGVKLRGNPGPGIGNTHIASVREVGEHFEQYYPDIDLGFDPSDSTSSIARLLTEPNNSVRVSVAYIRMMADYRFGSNGEPLTESHANSSQWTLEDGLAMWHSFRYGVRGINDGGQGFVSISDFQNRSLNTNQFFGVIRGPGAWDSVHDAIPFFEALGVTPNPGAPWNP